MAYSLNINGQQHDVEVEGDTPLLWVLRDLVGLTGTKYGCGISQCGACTVQVAGKPVRSCQTRVDAVGSNAVTTIEGVGSGDVGKKVQQAWLELDVVQCGFCQSGQIVAATALLESNPNPSDADIDAAMNGNLCKCGTYVRIRDAVKLAATL